jgi:hypothetical protein
MFRNNSSSLGLLFLALASSAYAGECRQEDHDISGAVHSYRPLGGGVHLPSRALQCGDTITSSMSLAADLICPTTTGFALNVLGANITLDGKGHKIVAPLAAAGVFVQGANDTVRNLTVNGVRGGDGILAYEAPGVRIYANDVSNNLQGIVLYADSTANSGADVWNNVARGNTLFGIRTGFDAPGSLVSPRIRGNDLSASGSYGLLLKASSFELGSDRPNVYAGSLNGIYLAGGAGSVHDLTLSNDHIQRISIFADSLDDLTVSNVDASTKVPGDANQDRIGIDMYRVAHFTVRGFDGSANDAGLKLETERGVNSTGTVTGSRFWNNTVSGTLEVSYDGTPYGILGFTRNCYRETVPAQRNFLVPGTVVAAGSVLDDGLNVCRDSGSGDDDRGGSCGGNRRDD